ncbi:MAG: DUF547 domain-containing protein [Pseudomonadales bacterium]|nr:DUF547 domain-containing protein [Pseudomonadales bacterium]
MKNRLNHQLNDQLNNSSNIFSIRRFVLSVFVIVVAGFSSHVIAAPGATLIPFWDTHDESSQKSIDHSGWQNILDKYVVSNHKSGVNRVDYAKIVKEGKPQLSTYISTMTSLNPAEYSRAEQKAYWINLYNALTVDLIVKNYPVDTITDLGKSFFKFGPWDDTAAEIQGKALTLNNIEHGVLRPIYQDNRIHYAVNCASFGCPNLSAIAFTAKNTDEQLNNAAHDYVNHSRGVMFDGDQLVVSSIYHWYNVDFGSTDSSLLSHLVSYAEPALAKKLQAYKGKIDNTYDWSLNRP